MNRSTNQALTEVEALFAYATMMNTGDTTHILPVLAPDFVLTSQTVFNDLHGSDAFVVLMNGKFKAMEAAGTPAFADLAILHGWGHVACVVLWQGEPLEPQLVVYADVKAGKLKTLRMCVVPPPQNARKSGLWPGLSSEQRAALPPPDGGDMSIDAFLRLTDAKPLPKTGSERKAPSEGDATSVMARPEADKALGPSPNESRSAIRLRELSLQPPPPREAIQGLVFQPGRPLTLPLRNSEAGLWGLLVGSAVGMPYRRRQNISAPLPPEELIDIFPPQGFSRSTRPSPPGWWSSDCGQVLALLDSLSQKRIVNLNHLATNMRRWHGGASFSHGLGIPVTPDQVTMALNHLNGGAPPQYAGALAGMGVDSHALLRVFPVLMHPWESRIDLAYAAIQQARITHAHPSTLIACAMFCLWVEGIEREGSRQAWENGEAIVRDPAFLKAFDFECHQVASVLDPTWAGRASGSDMVEDMLWSARIAFEQSSDYISCLRRAVTFDSDADLVGAIAGAVAGTAYGSDSIPEAWKAALKSRSEIALRLDRYKAALGRRPPDSE